MKLLLLIILSFVANAQDLCNEVIAVDVLSNYENKVAECEAEGLLEGLSCCCPNNECDVCETCADDDDDDTVEEPSGECDNGDVSDYTIEAIGQSTQFRIYDPCDKKFIKIKMEDLTEYEADGQKTNIKEVSFASAKDWSWGEDSGKVLDDCGGLGGACLYNAFVADELTKVDAQLVIETLFAVEKFEVPIVDDDGEEVNITVTEGSVKMNVEINNWVTAEEDSYLVLCMGIMTNKVGTLNEEDEGRVFRMNTAEITNLKTAECQDSDGNVLAEIGVEVEADSNNNNQLDLCYTFEPCAGNIVYDPIYALIGKADSLSVFVLSVAVVLSLLYV